MSNSNFISSVILRWLPRALLVVPFALSASLARCSLVLLSNWNWNKNRNTGLMPLLAGFGADIRTIAVLSLVTNLMMLAPTVYMLQLYDRVMVSRNEMTLLAVTGIACFLLLAMALAEWLRSVQAIRAGVRFDAAYNHRVCSGVIGASASAPERPAAEAMQHLTSVRQFVTGNGLFAFFDLPWSLLYIGVLFVLSPVLGALSVLFCTVQFGLAWWNQASSDAMLRTSLHIQAKRDAFLQGKVRHLETVHVMGMLPALQARWQCRETESVRHEAMTQRRLHSLQGISRLARYCMQSLMLGAAALLVIQGKISVGSMIASSVLIARVLHPFDVLVATWRQFVQARESAGALLGLPSSVQEAAARTLQPDMVGEVTLDRVSVNFGDCAVLRDVSLQVRPGRILTVMGASGSGKSTLARTLVGLVDPDHGRVLIDGILPSEIVHSHLAAGVGYLPQEVALLEGTIAENVARFGPLDAARIIAACQAVGMHETILRLPKGYETRIDEQGAPLSGGQRQLVGLARAVYGDPAIVVLDEPNSSLDEFGEACLMRLLQQLRQRGASVMVISHRSGLLKLTDDLLVLKQGKVEHQGPRDAGIAYLNQFQVLSMGNAA